MQTSAFYSEVGHGNRVLENQSRLEMLPPRLGGSVHPRVPSSHRLGCSHGGTASSDPGHLPARHKRRYFPGLWGPVQGWHPVHSAPPHGRHRPPSRALLRKLPTRLGQRGQRGVAWPWRQKQSAPMPALCTEAAPLLGAVSQAWCLSQTCHRPATAPGSGAGWSRLLLSPARAPGSTELCDTLLSSRAHLCATSTEDRSRPPPPSAASRTQQARAVYLGPEGCGPLGPQVRGGHRPTPGRASPSQSGSGHQPAFCGQLGTPQLRTPQLRSRTPAGGPAGSEGPQPGGGGAAGWSCAVVGDRRPPRPGRADGASSSQQGGAGPPESLMNINEQRRVKKINLPDSPIGVVVTI